MEPEDQSDQSSLEDRKGDRPDVTRDELYGLVWAEPMLKVAARFDV